MRNFDGIALCNVDSLCHTLIVRNTYTTKVKVTASILASLIIILSLQTPVMAAPKSISLTWTTAEMVTRYVPDDNFLIGQNPNPGLLKSEAKGFCAIVFPTGTVMAVFGASGRQMGLSTVKSPYRTQSKVIKGEWQVNDDGEDEYLLRFKCFGSAASPVTANSKSYSVELGQATYVAPNTKRLFLGTTSFKSPFFTVSELDSVNWKLKVELFIRGDLDCCFYENNIWNIEGSKYP